MTLIERLEAPHKAPEPYQSLGDLCLEAAARIRELEVALAPFADEAMHYDHAGDDDCPCPDPDIPDAASIDEINGITVGHVRNARALLSDGGEGRA